MSKLPLARAGWRLAKSTARGPQGTPFAKTFEPIEPTRTRAGLRLLQRSDAGAWTEGQRAMTERMTPWWSGGDQWEQSTDEVAFYQHWMRSRLMHARGTGVVMAITDEADRLVGEILMWNMTPGGGYAELGIWSQPHRGMPSMVTEFLTRCFEDWGITRLDSPVEDGNRNSLSILKYTGFADEGLLEKWRSNNAGPADYRMFGLTHDRWRGSRAAAGSSRYRDSNSRPA